MPGNAADATSSACPDIPLGKPTPTLAGAPPLALWLTGGPVSIYSPPAPAPGDNPLPTGLLPPPPPVIPVRVGMTTPTAILSSRRAECGCE